jgi:hypothetical protein
MDKDKEESKDIIDSSPGGIPDGIPDDWPTGMPPTDKSPKEERPDIDSNKGLSNS